MNILTVKVSSRGQIVIPESVREDLDIEEGAKLILIEKGNRIMLEKEETFLKELEEKKIVEDDEAFYRRMSAYANQDAWDNPEDEKMSQWYMKRSENEPKKK